MNRERNNLVAKKVLKPAFMSLPPGTGEPPFFMDGSRAGRQGILLRRVTGHNNPTEFGLQFPLLRNWIHSCRLFFQDTHNNIDSRLQFLQIQ